MQHLHPRPSIFQGMTALHRTASDNEPASPVPLDMKVMDHTCHQQEGELYGHLMKLASKSSMRGSKGETVV